MSSYWTVSVINQRRLPPVLLMTQRIALPARRRERGPSGGSKEVHRARGHVSSVKLSYNIEERERKNEKLVSIFVQHAYQKTTIRQLSHMLRQLHKMRSLSEVVSLRRGRCDIGGSRACSTWFDQRVSRLVEQLIVRVIAQVTERRCIR